ncbi:MAG: beta strand repeat-containing protein, partial [Flavobacteriales bacterium]
SGYMQFRFKARDKDPKPDEQVNTVNNINNFTTNCIAPTLSIRDKQFTSTMSTASFTLGTTQIGQSNQLTVKDQQGNLVPFTFNTTTRELTVNATLKPGVNTFTVYAQNECGSASEIIQITYNDCQFPQITLTNLNKDSSITVSTNTINVGAIIQHSTLNALNFFVNGIKSNGFAYNEVNHAFQATVALNPGKNLIKIEANNPCGSAYAVTEVIYNNCITPQLQLINPTSSGITVSTAAQKVQIKTIGFNAKTEFSVLLNGQATNTFTWINNVIEIPVTLKPGNNTITINGTNPCGSESVVIAMNYQECQAPVLTLQTPNTANVIVTKAAYTLKVKTQHQTAINLMVNNSIITNYTLNATSGILEYSFTLNPGLNIVSITSSNGCGVDIESLNITYQACNAPTVSISSTGGTTANQGFLFTANTANIANSQEIKLTQNGTAIPFTFSNGTIQAIATLAAGPNVFNVTVLNGCGTQSQTQNVVFNNCVTPTISLVQPIASGITVNEAGYQVQCVLSGVNNASEITFKVNGTAKPFQFINNMLTASLTLNLGINTISVSVKNACGNDSETFNITYKQCLAPSIVLTNPIQTTLTTTQNTANISFTAINCSSASQIVITKNGTLIPCTFLNGVVSLTASLTPGLNTYTLTATNDCGKDIANVNITYDNCVAPIITINSPIPSTTASQSLAVSAAIQNVTNVNQIALLLNGVGVPFTFNNGQLNATLTLVAGVNTVSLSVSNSCGTDVKAKTIEFIPCKSPTITITQPNNSGLTVSAAAYTLKAQINNAEQANQISLTLNGTPITNFQFSNGTLTAPVSLSNGINTFNLFVNNGCGVDQASTTVQLSTCNSPVVSLSNVSGQTVSTAAYTLNASVQEVANAQGLTLTLNGQVTPFNVLNGSVSSTFTLQPGINNIMLSATNGCGTDTKSIQVTYVPCIAPSVNLLGTNATVTSAAYSFSATVNGVNAQQLTLTQNGNPVQNFSINGNTLTASLTLQQGTNSIVLFAQNTCGTDRGELSVIYQNCTAPTVGISQLNDTVAQGVYAFMANLSNMPNSQGITLSLNGQNIPTFNFINGVLTASLNLANGANTISLNAINACGNASQNASVYYNHCQAPNIIVNSVLQASDGNYQYDVTLQNVYDIEGVYFTYNGQNVPFTFENGVIIANVTLNPGANTFYITASNNCGTDTETTTVTFANCTLPEITINGSIANGGSSTASSVMINASVIGYDGNTTVQVTKNGNVVNGLSWATGSISQNVNLSDGLNTITITATNACGTDTETYTVTKCKAPTISLISPASTVTNVSLAAYVLTFNIQNVSNANEISLTQNGSTLAGISLGGSIATLPVMLQAGANNFNLSVNTGCGSTQTSFTINYTANVAPPTNNPNTNDNNGGIEKPTNSPQNNNQPKPVTNTNKGGGGTAPNTPPPTPSPNKTPTPAKDVKPVVTPTPSPNNTPTPAKDVKPAVTPTPAPTNTPAKEVKPATNTNPTPAKETKPVEGGGTEKLPVQNKPAKGGGK